MGELADDFNFMKEQRQKHKDAVTPDRVKFAVELLKNDGHIVRQVEPGRLEVNGYITLWPYTGWWSGKTIGSGRGVKNLVDQLRRFR